MDHMTLSASCISASYYLLCSDNVCELFAHAVVVVGRIADPNDPDVNLTGTFASEER